MRSGTVHRARVRYIGNPATRAAWRIACVVPSAVRQRTWLGGWWTTTSQWAYCHSQKCLCESCSALIEFGHERKWDDEFLKQDRKH